MNAGELNRRITIQESGTARDAAGGVLSVWTDVCDVWASITDISGREYLSADARQNDVQTKIKIRYNASIKPKMRAVYGADMYNIEAVLGQDKRSQLLMCKRFA